MPGNKKPNRKPGVKKPSRSPKNKPGGIEGDSNVPGNRQTAKTYGAAKSSQTMTAPTKSGGSQRSR